MKSIAVSTDLICLAYANALLFGEARLEWVHVVAGDCKMFRVESDETVDTPHEDVAIRFLAIGLQRAPIVALSE